MFSVISAGGSGLLGAIILGSGLSGWYFGPSGLFERALLCAAGILLILPGQPSNAAGICIAGAVWLVRRKR